MSVLCYIQISLMLLNIHEKETGMKIYVVSDEKMESIRRHFSHNNGVTEYSPFLECLVVELKANSDFQKSLEIVKKEKP